MDVITVSETKNRNSTASARRQPEAKICKQGSTDWRNQANTGLGATASITEPAFESDTLTVSNTYPRSDVDPCSEHSIAAVSQKKLRLHFVSFAERSG